MFRWTPYVFIRFSIFLITGILIYKWFPGLTIPVVITTLCIGVSLYLTLWQVQRKRKLRLSIWFGLVAFIITAAFGWLCTYEQTETNHSEHILHQGEITYYTGKIVSEVQFRPKNYRAILEVEQTVYKGKIRPATGKVLIYTPKDVIMPVYGDKLLVYGSPVPLKTPPNPEEFDYKKYLSLQQIYCQQFIKKGKFVIYEHNSDNPILPASFRVRAWADQIFHQAIHSPNEYAIVSGLVLGIRAGLDNELKDAYASAGAMHILAVSGAHVILIFEVILLFLGRLKKIRYGNWIFAMLALLLLWFYAFVTGLSASVLRSVIMFSIVVAGDAIRRDGTLLNTLGLSAFVLLCYDPYLLQDVGFQLSYLAVAGIAYLYPKIYLWVEFQNSILNSIWQSICVSIVAQIAVLPLVLFYFHQFPTYFLLANILMIPLSGCVLYVGLVLLVTSWIPYVSVGISFVLQWITWLMNQIAFWTEQTPGALIEGSHIELWELGIMYLLLFSILLFFYAPKLKVWGTVTMLCLCLTISQSYGKIRHYDQRLLAVYALPGHSTLDIIEGRTHIFIADSTVIHDRSIRSFHLQNFWRKRQVMNRDGILFSQMDSSGLSVYQSTQLSLLTWQGKRFCILHQPVNLQIFRNQKFDYLIIQNNSIKNLKSFPLECFTTVILDASNRYYLAKRIEKGLEEKKVNCHNVNDEGAFIRSF